MARRFRFGRRHRVDPLSADPAPVARDVSVALTRRLETWLDEHGRTAWRPRVGEATLGTMSQFGGAPRLLEGEAHPSCHECNRPLQLIVQLDLHTLPSEAAELHGSGLLQLFYCTGGTATDGFVQCDQDRGWEPFSDRCSLVRIIDPDRTTADPAIAVAEHSDTASTIVDWEPFPDVPHVEDWRSLGLTMRFDRAQNTEAWQWPGDPVPTAVPEGSIDEAEFRQSATQDKLGGWPSWIQGAEYPHCPRCDGQMHLVMQIDSNDHVPFMWGDFGIGHITQCRDHRDVVAFGWACS